MIEIRQIQQIMLETSNLVALAVCRMMSPKSDMLTTREMFATYDHGWIKYHVNRGNLKGIKSGPAKNSPVYWSRLEIEALIQAEKIGPQLKDTAGDKGPNEQ